jgi:hypothetical protein
MPAKPNWSPITTCHPELPCTLCIELLTMAAMRMPMVMAHWYRPTTRPRYLRGEVSLWYRGQRAEMRPTPRPATTRPRIKTAQILDICIWLSVQPSCPSLPIGSPTVMAEIVCLEQTKE